MRTKGSWNRRLKAHNELNPDKVMEILNSYGEKGVSRLVKLPEVGIIKFVKIRRKINGPLCSAIETCTMVSAWL